MKRHLFAVAVLAVTLPGLALAGEPVPMNDSELDSTVAAGLADQILAHPLYAEAIARLRASPSTREAVRLRLLTVPTSVWAKNEAEIRRALPSDLHSILPPSAP